MYTRNDPLKRNVLEFEFESRLEALDYEISNARNMNSRAPLFPAPRSEFKLN